MVRAGHAVDALPLALIAGLLAGPDLQPVRAPDARGILAHRYGGQTPNGETVRSWGTSHAA